MVAITSSEPERILMHPVTPVPDLSGVYSLPTLAESVNSVYEDMVKAVGVESDGISATTLNYFKLLSVRRELEFCQRKKIKIYVTAYYAESTDCDEVFKIHSWEEYCDGYGKTVDGLGEILKDAKTMPTPFNFIIDDATGEILWKQEI